MRHILEPRITKAECPWSIRIIVDCFLVLTDLIEVVSSDSHDVLRIEFMQAYANPKLNCARVAFQNSGVEVSIDKGHAQSRVGLHFIPKSTLTPVSVRFVVPGRLAR